MALKIELPAKCVYNGAVVFLKIQSAPDTHLAEPFQILIAAGPIVSMSRLWHQTLGDR